MAAPGSLYGEGAQLLEGSAKSASDMASQKQAATDTTVKAGETAGTQVHEDIRDLRSDQAKMALEKLKSSEKMQGKVITITPQIGIGLVHNTGDKEWMQAIGQDMRADVLMGLYTHGMALQQAKKAPKVTQYYDGNGKIRHSVVYTDEQGNIQQHLLDEGFTPEALNKGKGGGGHKGGGSGETLGFKKNQQFIKSYEKARSELADPSRAAQLKASNPDSYSEKTQFLKDNQDKYDALLRSMSKAGDGGAQPAAAGAKAPDGGSAPFDAESFIKDALGQ